MFLPQYEPGSPAVRSLLKDRVTEYPLVHSDHDMVLLRKDRLDEFPPIPLGTRSSFDPTSIWTGPTTSVSTDTIGQLEVAQPTDQAQNARGVSSPAEPLATELALHNVTHLPYRSWCYICVQAKARQGQHR